jgi:hypothetical protein
MLSRKNIQRTTLHDRRTMYHMVVEGMLKVGLTSKSSAKCMVLPFYKVSSCFIYICFRPKKIPRLQFLESRLCVKGESQEGETCALELEMTFQFQLSSSMGLHGNGILLGRRIGQFECSPDRRTFTLR